MAKTNTPRNKFALVFADLLSNKKEPMLKPKKEPIIIKMRLIGFVIAVFM